MNASSGEPETPREHEGGDGISEQRLGRACAGTGHAHGRSDCSQKDQLQMSHLADRSQMLPVPKRQSLSQRQSRSTTRRVQFQRDSEGYLAETVHTYPAIPREFAPLCYYSQRETAHFRLAQKERAKQLVSNRPELVDSVLCLHGAKRRSTEKGGKEEIMSEQTAVRKLNDSNCRGLEHFMTDTICRHRKWAKRKILSVQSQCRGEDTEQVETLLRVWSLKVSHATSLYAHNAAIADKRATLEDPTITSQARTLPVQRISRRGERSAVKGAAIAA